MGHEHGVDVNQVEAITMPEAKNAAHFADPDSVRGIAQCVAFTMGTLLAGRQRS